MPSVAEQINQDFLKSYKAGEKEISETLKMIKAALAYAEKESGKILEDSEALAILKKEAKKRVDAAEQYIAGERKDLADKEKMEVEIIKKYLPAEMEVEKIEEKVKEAIAKLGAGISDFGAVMKELMGELKGQVDGAVLSELVKKNLK